MILVSVSGADLYFANVARCSTFASFHIQNGTATNSFYLKDKLRDRPAADFSAFS